LWFHSQFDLQILSACVDINKVLLMATTAAPVLSQKNAKTNCPTRTKIKSDPPLDFSFFNISSPEGKF